MKYKYIFSQVIAQEVGYHPMLCKRKKIERVDYTLDSSVMSQTIIKNIVQFGAQAQPSHVRQYPYPLPYYPVVFLITALPPVLVTSGERLG